MCRGLLPLRPTSLALPNSPMTYPGELLDHHRWRVERRGDGALLVRVSCQSRCGDGLPDAVFTFRTGDPQYGYWDARLQEEIRG